MAAVASAVGGFIQSNAAGNAAQAQESAANNAASLQYQEFQKIQQDDQPWMQAGQNALSQMQNPYYTQQFGMAQFQQDPAYQFDLNQGLQALQASAAARGGLMSGNTLTAINNYAQGQASNEYQNAFNRFEQQQQNSFNRLGSIAGMGQNALSQINAAGQNYANQAGSDYMGAGNAQAAGILGKANAWSGAISNIGNGATGATLLAELNGKTPNPVGQNYGSSQASYGSGSAEMPSDANNFGAGNYFSGSAPDLSAGGSDAAAAAAF